MPNTTFSAVIRSFGGDARKATYPGVVPMVAPFYFDPTAANTTAVQRSASDTADVVLPANAIILEILVNAAGTGGSTPTFDMGWIEVDDATTLDVDGLVAEGDADVGMSIFTAATATAGAGVDLGAVTDRPFRLTGGVGASAATGGAISGLITYIVSDAGDVDQ